MISERIIFMLCFGLILGFHSSCSFQEDQLPTLAQGEKWVKVSDLSDEFNGNSLDTVKWMPKHPYWSGRNSTFTASNVSVNDGNLRLKSTLLSEESEVKAENITSACMSSNTPRSNYGYYEARIKASDLSMTSAFWFQGTYSEIDVIENMGNASLEEKKWMNSSMMTNTHYYKEGWDNDVNTPFNWAMPTSSASEYHVYGVWWKDAKTVWFYHNGTKIHEVNLKHAFNETQTMFFDTEVFTWNGWPTKESLLDPNKNTMLVDWVRAWEIQPE